MVREEDAAALVVREAVALKLAGYDPVITAANEAWLMRYAVLMIDAYGIGRETEKDDDPDCPHHGKTITVNADVPRT